MRSLLLDVGCKVIGIGGEFKAYLWGRGDQAVFALAVDDALDWLVAVWDFVVDSKWNVEHPHVLRPVDERVQCTSAFAERRNVDVRFYRVEDPDLHILANESETVNNCYEDITALPIATPEKLVKSDMIILGCPTVFGNVTAEMKSFIDSTIGIDMENTNGITFFSFIDSSFVSLRYAAHNRESSRIILHLIHINYSTAAFLLFALIHCPVSLSV